MVDLNPRGMSEIRPATYIFRYKKFTAEWNLICKTSFSEKPLLLLLDIQSAERGPSGPYPLEIDRGCATSTDIDNLCKWGCTLLLWDVSIRTEIFQRILIFLTWFRNPFLTWRNLRMVASPSRPRSSPLAPSHLTGSICDTFVNSPSWRALVCFVEGMEVTLTIFCYLNINQMSCLKIFCNKILIIRYCT